jgi:hypothetical protein
MRDNDRDDERRTVQIDAVCAFCVIVLELSPIVAAVVWFTFLR